jgi:hypothetical protein
MSQELMKTLRSVLNTLDNPAFISKGSKILIVNDLFLKNGFEKDKFDEQIKQTEYVLSKNQLNDGMTLCEILPDEIMLLKNSTKKLTKAMAML